ncbi:MAG: 5'/3'-nucleotidase SurE [Ignavibacteriae bacterium]|nr:5'/3'-nucleotidase SurE [Ignavibacteriota bacterium]
MKRKKEIKILVTNDDGIDSPGIFALVHSMKRLGKVVVVAPDRQQSAVGHALTVSDPLRVVPFHRNGEMFGYAINGTPSDCVKLAMSSLLNEKPNLVVSGINHGQNTSINILYSGTVSAATEGMLLGIPSIAVSLASYSLKADCSVAAEFSYKIATKVLKSGLPDGTLLNVNVPSLQKDKIKGLKITRQSDSQWNDHYEKRTDPFGRDYYWFSGEYKVIDKDLATDDAALLAGYVSVTPIQFKFTNYDAINKLKILEKKR